MCYAMVSHGRGVKFYDKTRTVYEPYPAVYRDSAYQDHQRIRRCGKSVMLELIRQELTESGVSQTQFISIHFEDMRNSHLQTAQALHDEFTVSAAEIKGKV